MSKVTLAQIAQKLSLSQAAVSLAMRNNPKISLAKRLEVQNLAKALGYKPNPWAVSLANSRHQSRTKAKAQAEIAWINHWPTPGDLRRHPGFEDLWRGCYEEALSLGYSLKEMIWDKKLTVQRMEKILLARGVQGIIIPPHRVHLAWENFRWEAFHVIRLGYSVPKPKTIVVASNQLYNCQLAHNKMRAYGYKRIGFISTHSYAKVTFFQAGYLLAQSQAKEKSPIPMLLLSDGNQLYLEQVVKTSNEELLKKWLKKYRPDAILTTHGLLGNLLKQIDYKVPQDLAVATINILDGSCDTGIDERMDEIGAVCVQTLVGQMNQRMPSFQKKDYIISISGQWIDGHSLPNKKEIFEVTGV